jgi:hypothetical protein
MVNEKDVAKRTAEEALKSLRKDRLILTRREKRPNGKNWTFLPDRPPPSLREDRQHREDFKQG